MNLPDLNLFKKNFVSLVITSTTVKLVKLNSKLDKVEFFAQKPIPPGVMMNYRVQEKKVLVKVITDLWKEQKIRDKFVGVVVPEFATYTKTINLPNLSDTEIGEALKWQLQELLPTPVEDVIADWKVIKRTKEGSQILVVSILKEVLMGYIDVIGEAGLSPLVVETPSLSIERITNGDNSHEGKLVIYVSKPGALLVMTKGHQIVASSVGSSENLNIVINTALQMMSHYKETEVKSVIIGGTGVTQDLISHLNYNLAKPVSFLKKDLAGMQPVQVQDYLLGISLQMKDPSEPTSETTVNLLPPGWADKYRHELMRLKIWTLTLIISIVTWASFLSAFTVFILLGFQVDSLSNQGTASAVAGFNQAIAEVQSINKKVDNLVSISQGFRSYTKPINILAGLKTGGISLNSYLIDLETGAVKISGISSDRTSLIQYKNAIESDENFSDINNFPVTRLLQESNISFEFETKYLPFFKPKKANIKLKI